MRQAIVAISALSSLWMIGCSCGSVHELTDAAMIDDVGTDTPTAVDAGADARAPEDAFVSGERFFTLEPATVDLFVVAERCAENEGATAMLRVTTHVFSTCDSPGPIDVVRDPTTTTITVTSHVWREHGRTDCAAIGAAYTRDVAIDDLTAGAWTIVSAGTAVPYVVDAAPAITCPSPGLGTIAAGEMCQRDCQCAPGLSCLAVRGDAACARFCGDPCEHLGRGTDLSLSCATGDTCAEDPNLGWTCSAATTDECPCPAGMTCPPVTEGPLACVWEIALDSATRHACTTESECDPGLDCVQRVDGVRACEVRCTTSDMACPNNAPHACLAGNWVCEWLGE